MVPGVCEVIDAFPVTASGKIDRPELVRRHPPSPGPRGVPGPSPEDVARTPTEETLTTIWRHVLGVDAIGVHDSFFELGGHSLLATQVVSRARRTFGVELPLALLFAQPTVAGLARRIDLELRSSVSKAELPPPIQPADPHE